jgi:hypothetical protein
MPSRRDTTTRRTRKRAAAEAIDLCEDADNEGTTSAAGPSKKRRNTGAATGGRRGGSSRAQAEPIVIEDLDEVEDDGEAAKLKETLQKQREEQVQALKKASEEPPRLNKLQCVICMDSFTDMTATSCGMFARAFFFQMLLGLTFDIIGHIFCHECLISALRASEARRHQSTGHHGKKSQCPVCRTNLNRTKKSDVIPLLLMKKGMATQPRRAKNG